MVSCDLCGKPATTKARIEGVILHACAACAQYGTELNPPPRAGNAPIGRRASSSLKAEEGDTALAGDFGMRLRNARQRLKLTEKEASAKLLIRESTLLHYEAGKLQPDETTIHRLEKFYGISLRISI